MCLRFGKYRTGLLCLGFGKYRAGLLCLGFGKYRTDWWWCIEIAGLKNYSVCKLYMPDNVEAICSIGKIDFPINETKLSNRFLISLDLSFKTGVY